MAGQRTWGILGAFIAALALWQPTATPALGQAAPAPGPSAAAGSGATSGASVGVLRLGNAYVQVVLNASADGGGRFTINATGGNPDRPDDDGKPLLYGGDEPWTSFTTVRIADRDFVFGGVTHRPAGRGGPFGQPTVPPRLDPQAQVLEAGWLFPPGVEVLQRLSLTRGLTTGLVDTVRIEYVIINRTDQVQMVGLRLVLDVMAGSNDGAPFRVGGQAIETDTAYSGGVSIPDFWQVFDSLTQPAVVAQGTLRGEGLTPPDRIYFTNWGVLRDSLWEFDFQPGRSFERLGELELDSAVALFFDPVPVPPGQRRVVATAYGLGGISIAPGQLAVGLSGPEMAVVGKSQPFTVVAYVQNTGQGAARDLRLTLHLPEGLAPVPGEELVRRLGELPAGHIAQAAWRVQVNRREPGNVQYAVRAEAENAEPNQASRTLRLVSPARLRVELRGPTALSVVEGRWAPVPFRVEAELVNEGGAPAAGLWVQLNSPLLSVAPGDSPIRYVGVLQPGERYVMGWLVQPNAVGPNLPWSVRVRQPGGEEMRVPTSTVAVPPLPPMVALHLPGAAQPARLRPGEPLNLAVDLLNPPADVTVEVELSFDPKVLRIPGGPLGIDPLPALAPGSGAAARPTAGPDAASAPMAVHLDPAAGRVLLQAQLGRVQPWERLNLAVIRFVGTGEGSALLRVVRASAVDAAGRRTPFQLPDGQAGPGAVAVTVAASASEPPAGPAPRGGTGP